MEVLRERPKKRKESTTSRSSVRSLDLPQSVNADAAEVHRLVRRVENLEVVRDPIGPTTSESELCKKGQSSESAAEIRRVVTPTEDSIDGQCDSNEVPVEKLDVSSEKPENIQSKPIGGFVEHEEAAKLDEKTQWDETMKLDGNVESPDEKVVSVGKVELDENTELDEKSELDENTEPEKDIECDSTASIEVVSSSKYQLYPELGKMPLQEAEKSESLVSSVARPPESAPPMTVEFEPLTEMQLRSFYYNYELERADEFVDEFLKSTLRPTSSDELSALLQSYLDSCRREEQLLLDAQDLNQRWDSARRNVWIMENVHVRQQGNCGEGKPASGVSTVQRAKFQDSCYDELKNLAQRRIQVRIFRLALASHQTKSAELQCKNYIYSAVQDYRKLTGVSAAAPIFLLFDGPPVQLVSSRMQLRQCINVLFHFLRNPLGELPFVNSCRLWLNELVGTLLRYSFVDDHLFILCHILRCPNGIGAWAAGHVQPVCQLDSITDGERAVDHFLAMLSVCLNPIRRREEYLKSYMSPDVVNSWTVVDADGEEECEMVSISEADLLCVLNQFSFDRLFSTWFKNLQNSEVTESKILRLFAFELTFLRILFDGMRVYNGTKYKQICKQLAYEMRKSVQYVAEFWSYFKSLLLDYFLCGRLQAEFDRLLLYAVFYGLSSKGLGVWQFLADLPYGDASEDCQWRLTDLLLSSLSDGLSPRELAVKPISHLRQQLRDPKILELRLHDLDQSDAVYLLTALSVMASSSKDDDLVGILTTLLCTACFESPATRETHHKAGRQLVGSIAQHHDWLFTSLLKLVESKLDRLGGYSIELFDHLPLSKWRMNDEDWSIVRRWLYQPLSTLPNALAQCIILACNWGIDCNTKYPFIQPRLHRHVAMSLASAYDQLCPIQFGLISGSIKKASKIASSMSGQLSVEQKFIAFCWTVLLRLKLHQFDYECVEMETTETEREDLLTRGRNGNPIAAYVAFQSSVTRVDHLVQFGIDSIEQMLAASYAKPATVSVVYAMRLMAENDGFYEQERFLRCVDTLIHFDDTYYQYAKTFIAGSSVGETLANFASMLSETVLTLTSGRQSDAYKFVHYSIQLLCSSERPCWNDRPSLYVLDRLIEASFLNDPSMKDIVRILRLSYENTVLSQHRTTKSGVLSIFRGDQPPPPLLHPSYFRDYPWLAYAAIQAEEMTFQQFYHHLMFETMRHPSHSLEASVKACARKYGTPFSVDRLVPSMFLELFSVLDSDSPLVPLVCQQCCLGLLRRGRIPEEPASPLICLGSYYLRNSLFSDKVTTFKKMLQSYSVDAKMEDPVVGSRVHLYGAVSRWISENRLFELPMPSTGELPLYYLLDGVLSGNETPWLDYVDFTAVRSSVEKRANDWVKCRLGEIRTSSMPSGADRPPASALQRLLERLSHVEDHPSMPPPVIGPVESVIAMIDMNMLKEDGDAMTIVKQPLDNFYAAARDFDDMHESILSMDQLFFDQLRVLYAGVNVQITVQLKCDRNCASPNNKKITVTSSQLLDGVQNYLDQNRGSWSNTIDNISALLSSNIPHHCVSFYAIVSQLVRLYGDYSLAGNTRKKVKNTGVWLFYKLVSICNDRLLEFPPTKDLLQASIRSLGGAFIAGNGEEFGKLCHLLKEKQTIFPILITIFDPNCTSNDGFVWTYEKVANWIILKDMSCDRLVECLKKLNLKGTLPRLTGPHIERVNRLALDASIACQGDSHVAVLNMLRADWIDSFLTGLPSIFLPALRSMLTACEQGALPVVIFEDLLSTLSSVVAKDVTPIGPAVFSEIVIHLINYFHTRKLECKECTQCGLYHCWELYGEKVSSLLTFCFVHSILNPDAYSSPAEGIRRSISCLQTLFRPWIEPHFTDKDVHTPWSFGSAAVAEKFLQGYTDSLCFIQKIFNDDSNESTEIVLSLALEWYFGIVNRQVDKLGTYVLRSYQAQLLRLPWQKFLPSITIMEAMRQISSKGTHSAPFITSLLVRIPLTELRSKPLTPALVTIYDLLLNTVVICASNERNYTDCKASLPELLEALSGFDWSPLGLSTIENLCEYLISAYDVKCIVRSEEGGVETGVLKLLSSACGFTHFPQSPVLPQSSEARNVLDHKRIRYVKTLVTMAVRCSRHAAVSTSTMSQYFVSLISRIDALLRTEDDPAGKHDLALKLVSQAVVFLHHSNQQLFDDSVASVNAWLEEHPDSLVSLAVISVYGTSALTVGAWITVTENCIRSYFMRWSPAPTWRELLDWLVCKPDWLPTLKSTCQEKGTFLTFYAVCRKRLEGRRESAEETLLLRDVMETLRMISEKQFSESPIVLLTGLAVELLVRHAKLDGGARSIVTWTRELVACLQNAAEGKTGILSSLGLAKRVAYSPRFQLLCTIVCNYLQQQIINDDHIRRTADATITNSREHWAKHVRGQKQYSSFTDALDTASSFITDPSKYFDHVLSLYCTIAPLLFTERYVIDQCSVITSNL